MRTMVRKTLQLKAGGILGFEIEGNEVRLRRATPFDLVFPQALEGTTQRVVKRGGRQSIQEPLMSALVQRQSFDVVVVPFPLLPARRPNVVRRL